MGSPQDARISEDDESEVEVEFDHGFWLGKYEFTRREAKSIAGHLTYMASGDHNQQPLDKARKDDPPKWLEILNKSAPKGWVFDLPTEAEWEYAARAGTTSTFYFGENVADLPKHANFADVSLRNHEDGYYTHAHRSWNDGHQQTAKVGSYQPNPWGFYDMYGNIAEMTSTHYHPQRTPPEEFDAVTGYVTRGGCWLSIPEYCRSAFRNHFGFQGSESIKPNHTGFRFVLRRKP
jgi:formylglycine-generating enzyme required for sulfatase activity